jgi:hypothetical protein
MICLAISQQPINANTGNHRSAAMAESLLSAVESGKFSQNAQYVNPEKFNTGLGINI